MPRALMPFPHTPAKRRALALITLLILSAGAACSRSADESAAVENSDSFVRGGIGYAPEQAQLRSRVPAPSVGADAIGDALPPVSQDSATAPQMLIRTGNVSVRVDSLELAVAAVRRLATSVGGFVGNVSVNTGEYEVRSATLDLRVPAPRFDDVMAGMAPLGRVEHSSTNVQDVGEEFVDIGARVANAERLEARLVALLANRTGNLEDVLAVERELARVREQIERHEGRLRFLGARVTMSTVHVTVSEPPPVVGSTPGRSVIGAAFIKAWQNFVSLIAWTISSLGVIIPVALVLWGAFWLLTRRRRH